MSDDGFNMSLRRFLKRVGVTSQQRIEDAVREGRESGALAGKRSVKARMTLQVEGMKEDHVVEGEIVIDEQERS